MFALSQSQKTPWPEGTRTISRSGWGGDRLRHNLEPWEWVKGHKTQACPHPATAAEPPPGASLTPGHRRVLAHLPERTLRGTGGRQGRSERCAPAELRRSPPGLPAFAERGGAPRPCSSSPAFREKQAAISEVCRGTGTSWGRGPSAAASGRPRGHGVASPAAPAHRGGGNRAPHRGAPGWKAAAGSCFHLSRISAHRRRTGTAGGSGRKGETPLPKGVGIPNPAGSADHLCHASRREP